MSRFSVSGAKSARYLAVIGLVLLCSSPLVLLWASRSQVSVTGDDAVMLELSRMEARQIAGLQLPPGTCAPRTSRSSARPSTIRVSMRKGMAGDTS